MSEQNQRPGPAAGQPRPPATTSGWEPHSRLVLARLAVWWEHLAPALWLPFAIAALFLALAFLNIFPALPGWLHAVLLLAFAGGFAVSLWHGRQRWQGGDTNTARRRLERDSGLAHRPLQGLRDRPAGDDPTAQALWDLHQERLRASLGTLRVDWPLPDVASSDRYALRGLAALLLLVGVGFGWGDLGPRLASALTPQLEPSTPAVQATLDLWIAPPEHTRLPPIFLTGRGAGADPSTTAPAETGQSAPAVEVPTGSTLLARVTGGRGTPQLEAGGEDHPLEAVTGGGWQIEHPLTGGDQVAVRQNGSELGRWKIRILADDPPAIAFAQPPAGSELGILRIDHVAHDDYGLASLGAVIKPTPELQQLIGDAAPFELALPLAGQLPREAKGTSNHDLAPHEWAGLPVTIELTATDGAGQRAHTAPLTIDMPQRNFTNPVARSLIEQRRRLIVEGANGRMNAARGLAEIGIRPDLFGGDVVVYLAIRTAVDRLLMDESLNGVKAVRALLWDTALRIEDGGLSIAERELRDIQQKLADALDRNASDEEIRKLMDELRQAIDQYLDAMQEQLQQALDRGEQIPQIPPELADQMMDRQDLQQMLDQMQNLAETGARDAAREMLSQLQQMMEQLRNGAFAQQQGQNGQQPDMQQMRELEELARQQQQLMDETFRQNQQRMNEQMQQEQRPGQRPNRQRPGNTAEREMAERQEQLRGQLGEMMRMMGESQGDIPRPLGRAERAMRDAAQALQQGNGNEAMRAQGQAMQELQASMDAMMQQMMQQMMGSQPGEGMGSPQDRQRMGRDRDPLGRRPPGRGMENGNDVKIPEQSDIQRAREILDELRRRSGEFGRPQQERDYIDRLLRQF